MIRQREENHGQYYPAFSGAQLEGEYRDAAGRRRRSPLLETQCEASVMVWDLTDVPVYQFRERASICAGLR